MSKLCQVCGGLVASGGTLGYSGAICSGLHHQYGVGFGAAPGYTELRLSELEQRVFDLTQRLSQPSATDRKPRAASKKATK